MSLKTYILPLYFIIILLTGCGSTHWSSELPETAQKSAIEPQNAVPVNELNELQNQSEQKFEVKDDLLKANLDACMLISKSEIEAVQGEAVKETKNSSKISGSLIVSQCFYQLATYSKSVSLEITQSNPSNSEKYNLREFWKEKFNTRAAEDNDREQDNDRDGKSAGKKSDNKENSNQPQAVRNLGDAAFRVGNRITGALYVLKKNTIIRISIGGAEDELTKMKKLRILAQKALKRV